MLWKFMVIKSYPSFGMLGLECGSAKESFVKEVMVKLIPES